MINIESIWNFFLKTNKKLSLYNILWLFLVNVHIVKDSLGELSPLSQVGIILFKPSFSNVKYTQQQYLIFEVDTIIPNRYNKDFLLHLFGIRRLLLQLYNNKKITITKTTVIVFFLLSGVGSAGKPKPPSSGDIAWPNEKGISLACSGSASGSPPDWTWTSGQLMSTHPA